MKDLVKKYHIASIVLIMIILGFREILYSFYMIKNYNASKEYSNLYIINCLLLGIYFLFLTKGLLQRMAIALLINIITILLLIIVNIFHNTHLEINLVLLFYLLISLLKQRRWFRGKSDHINFKIGIVTLLILVVSDLFILATTVRVKSDLVIFVNITFILIITFLIMRPLKFNNSHTYEDKLKVQELLKKFAINPVSAIILEDDKRYFFSKLHEGVIGYTVINNIALVAGEPICSSSDMKDILSEFKKFCSNKSLSACFCQTTEVNKEAFEKAGFILQEYGKEAILHLDAYTIAGSKTSKIRWANNKMDKLGIKVVEYKPLIKKDEYIEAQILEVSDEWLQMKKSSELSFMLGSISLDSPFDRRYFIATDDKNIILAFMVCFPYKSGKGYFIDITRRRKEAPLGIMEKLTIDICRLLKEDDVKEVSLGLAPLADIEVSKSKLSLLMYATFNFIYKYMNAFYGFKALYDYKKKYNPSSWEPRFIAFSSETFMLSIGYAMIKAKHPKGLVRLVIDIIKGLKK